VTAYCTVNPVNPHFVGWGGSAAALFSYVESRPEQFVQRTFVIGMPIAELEMEAAKAGPNRFLVMTRPLAFFNPDAEKPEMLVYCYMKPDTYPNLVEKVRREFTRRLLRLLQ